ncbi:MAG: AAA family ATPase [Eubacteriaceae bacterium]|nr:AAA family ATPase [Eubacteriaceae bacterium]
MIINELYLIAFGKFINKKVSLKPGLNLIYGGNESGKTTMHKFIEGMFFGFFKPYSKNKLYTLDYAKFTPWNGQDYKGVIVYEKNNRRYRLERSFSKNNESIKLYDDVSGADLSDMLDFDFSYKMPKANKHIPINNVLFKNTVSIGQLSNITDKGLVKEISDLFADTSGTHSSGVSLKAAIEQLQSKIAIIGSHSSPKTVLGKDALRLSELEEERVAAEEAHEENKQRYIEISRLENELRSSQQQKGEASELKEKLRLSQMLSRHEKYMALQSENEGLDEAINSHAEISEEAANEFDKANIQLEIATKQHSELLSQRTEIERAVSVYETQLEQANASVTNSSIDGMLEDKAILDNSLRKIEALTAEKNANEDTTIESRYEKIRKQQKLFSFSGTIASIIAVFAIILFFPLEHTYLLYAGIISAIAGISLLGMWAVSNRRRNKIEDEFEKYDTVMSRTMNMLLMCELDIEQIRSKYGTKSVKELVDYLTGSQDINSRITEMETQISVSMGSLNDINERIISVTEEIDELTARISQIVSHAGAPSIESFKYAVMSIKEKAVAKARLESNLKNMENLLAGMPVKALQQEAAKALEYGIEPSSSEAVSLDIALEQNSDEILRISGEIAALRANIAQTESSVRQLNEIVEEIVKTKSRIGEFEADLKSYTLAIEKIELLSKDIQHTFADAFNEYVSNMISEITKGKYTRVQVNDNMQIKVEDQELGQLIDISSLSGGTIDQLYFCVRFAIMDLIIKDKTIPVFLDDCMLQYDDQRLSNILNLLYEKSKDRQIIIFTCRKAEKLALDEKNYYYNFVNLSKTAQPRRQAESNLISIN